jgi:putative endonuclease
LASTRHEGKANASNAAVGLAAEDLACAALVRDGFVILGRRLRTTLGEVDVVAATAELLVFAEVKQRADLGRAAAALGARQQARLLAAAEYLLAVHPEWERRSTRFDVLLVDRAGRVRRVADAFRQE